jgi:hypothetical protein
MDTIDIHAYQQWHDSVKGRYQREYSEWLNAHDRNARDEPRIPDWSVEAYTIEMSLGVPIGIH